MIAINIDWKYLKSEDKCEVNDRCLSVIRMNSDSDMSRSELPIYYPSMDEFKDFQSYICKIESINDFGYAKIVPPRGWFTRNYDLDKLNFTIPTPIRQLVSGKPGIHHVDLIELKEMSIQEYYDFATRNSCTLDLESDKERYFWRSLGNNGGVVDPVYGADIPGSLFGDDEACSWNVNKLPNKLKLLGNDVKGVNSAMLYVGSWRAMFAYHVEDMNLFSINYLHTGAPKSWCFIPPRLQKRFEHFSASHFQEEFHQCSNYLRHKTKIFSPQRLRAEGIDVHTVLQSAGEFMITFPRAYHCGFNYGFNIAESTNFATTKWISDGYSASVCRCAPYSVRLYMPYVETLIRRDKHYHIQNGTYCAENGIAINIDTDANVDTEDVDADTGLDGVPLRMRCRCSSWRGPEGPPVANRKALETAAINQEIFWCVGCDRWCHIPCVAVGDVDVVHTEGEEVVEEYKTGLCDICHAIERDLDEELLAPGGRIIFLPDIDEGEGEDGMTASASSPTASKKRKKGPSSSPSSSPSPSKWSKNGTKQGTEIVIKKTRKRKRNIEVGTRLLLLRTPDSYGFPLLLSHNNKVEDVEARVVAVEEGHARIHVKGEHRDQDEWLDLKSEFRPIELEGDRHDLVDSLSAAWSASRGSGSGSGSATTTTMTTTTTTIATVAKDKDKSKKSNLKPNKSKASKDQEKKPSSPDSKSSNGAGRASPSETTSIDTEKPKLKSKLKSPLDVVVEKLSCVSSILEESKKPLTTPTTAVAAVAVATTTPKHKRKLSDQSPVSHSPPKTLTKKRPRESDVYMMIDDDDNVVVVAKKEKPRKCMKSMATSTSRSRAEFEKDVSSCNSFVIVGGRKKQVTK
eukprot:gene1920-3728_t